MNLRRFTFVAALLAVALSRASAQVPQLLNYQGRVTVGATPFAGTGQFRFALVDTNSSTTYWSNDGTSVAGSQPTAGVTLPVAAGLYSVLLGDTALANMSAIPASVFANSDVRIRVWFNDGTNGSQLLTPDQRVAAVGYAMVAGTVPDGAITGAKLGVGAAAANLSGAGQSGVTSGGIVLSTGANPALVAAGYVRIGTSLLNDFWQQNSRVNAPTARDTHTAVWTGTEMIIWGGEGLDLYGDGARYNPAANTWTTLPSSGAPTARRSHTAVWSGTEMIVWGGRPSANFIYYGDGARYNPTTNTWIPVSGTGAPPGRISHSVVWTGTEMIVWGGYSFSGGTLNSGGRYSPTSNSWINVSTTSAPTGRYLHTSVWTGTEMIVWGGLDSSDYVNTGGHYNPATDTWTATSVTSVPAGRNTHTAVWTGTEMIIWGGKSTSTNFNDGGRYNPTSRVWTALNSTGAPGARNGHTAVWTGSNMIVWGGINSSGFLGDGGVYNFATDSWTATTSAGAPAARYLHTAIWTGQEMIVWGGTTGVSSNDNFSYNPAKYLFLYQRL